MVVEVGLLSTSDILDGKHSQFGLPTTPPPVYPWLPTRSTTDDSSLYASDEKVLLDSLGDWLNEDKAPGSDSRGSLPHAGERTNFVPVFPVPSFTYHSQPMLQSIPHSSFLFNGHPLSPPPLPPATLAFDSPQSIPTQFDFEWGNDVFLSGPFSGLMSPSSSSASSFTDCSINSSPAFISYNTDMEGLRGVPAPDREDTPDQHSPIHTSFNSSPQLVHPSILPVANPVETMSHEPTVSSLPGKPRRASRHKAMRPSPYAESPRVANGHSSSSALIPINNDTTNDITRSNSTSLLFGQTSVDATDDNHSGIRQSKAQKDKTNATSPSHSLVSPPKPSPKRIPCTHPDCDKTFTRQNDLAKHLNNAAVHNAQSDPECICPNCGVSLSRSDALQRHMRSQACGKRKATRKAALLPFP